ncbi:MAG: cation:proton antiporter [Lactobacillales bacterium]|jgi:CPA1 family monovalent cation:H+ antiporter|nr:cation:proton antiporter [Lactobacillales bacterium]
MHAIYYVIAFFTALILSNVVNKIFPKVPLPLIQIILGFGMGFIGAENVVRLNPEMFLALVVAPLLFRDGQEANVSSILKHWKLVGYLAFIVVFATVFSLGLTVHSLLPAIPLAACFAVGASLGPTDVIAVGSISSRLEFPKRVSNVLKGEGLINDASGIIAFQFAIAALTTGKFSLLDAGWAVAFSAVGGAVVGFLVAWIHKAVTSLLEEVDARDITGYLVIEIFLPFLAFFISEEIGVSGIIAAVVAGIMQASSFKQISLFDAQLDTVTNTIWNTITFALNAVVFVLLGIELQQVFLPTLESDVYSNVFLFVTIIVVTALLFVTRFLCLVLYYFVISRRRKQPFKRYMQDMLLTTFSGVKGTVSIATILLTPEYLGIDHFVERPLMMFVTAGVTLLSFIVGILVLPLLSETKQVSKNHLVEIAILDEVVAQLEEDAKNLRDKRAMEAAIDNYRLRIQDLIVDSESDTIKKDLQELRLMILQIEIEGLEEAYKKHEIDELSYTVYKRYTQEMERVIIHKFVSSINFLFVILKRMLYSILHQISDLRQGRGTEKKRNRLTHDERKAMRNVYLVNTERILTALENLEGIYDEQLINFLQAERIRQTELLHERAFIDRVIQRAIPNNTDEMMRGYYLERKLIYEYEDEGLLSKREAQNLRRNVNTLESYSLKENYSSLPYEFFDYLRHHGN